MSQGITKATERVEPMMVAHKDENVHDEFLLCVSIIVGLPGYLRCPALSRPEHIDWDFEKNTDCCPKTPHDEIPKNQAEEEWN